MKCIFQLWSIKIDNRNVDSIDCGIAFEDRVHFEDKINNNIKCLNFAMLEVRRDESEKQELKLLIQELEQLHIELVENFEKYNNHLIERPPQNIFDGLSDFSVEETDVNDIIESIFDGVSNFSDDEMSVEDLNENIFDDLSDFSDVETEDDDSDEIIRNRILHHRIVFYDSDGEIEDEDVNINTLINKIV